MSNLDKTVKLACKPKNAAPKAKVCADTTSVLVAATYSDDGSILDICRSLSLRLREPNAVVVFKALLVLHQMIRSGSTDQLLDVLSQGDILRLRNVGGQNWDGYNPPSNMSNYATYLDIRIRAYREIKHDLVQVQTESNRRSNGLGAGSKARRLRHLPVEKGLLREVKQVQRILDSLILCKFYDDDLREENTVLAFRMLVKDLLVLFQAGNEGVCNILEHYFEMSKLDATESFQIYKSFIKQTDRVVDYLAVARKLHNIVNVPVPNLKHAPTGLVKALEEYLNDPNFEQNRQEYRKSLGVVEGKARTPSPNPPSAKLTSPPSPKSAPPIATSVPGPSAPAGADQKIQDFFDSIQTNNQPTMFPGPAQSLGYSQTAAFNPFRQSTMLPQQTGFIPPQATGFGMPSTQPFIRPQMTGALAFGNRQTMFVGDFGQPQPQQFIPQQTGFQSQPQPLQSQQTGFIQPQTTGSNPFRQSMFSGSMGSIGQSGPFSQPPTPFYPTDFSQPHAGGISQIQRPGSTPALGSASLTKPLQAQATGSKNPFAPPGGVPAPLPPPQQKGPNLNQLASGAFGQHPPSSFQPALQSHQTGQTQGSSPWSTSGQSNVTGGTGNGSAMADIASAFTLDNSNNNTEFLAPFGGSSTATSSNSQFAGNNTPNFLNSQFTGSTSSNPLHTQPTGFIQPQQTGYGGSFIKPFKPTSNFGNQLVESLPPIPEPSPVQSPNQSGHPGQVQAQQTGFPFGGQGQGGVQSQHTVGSGQIGSQGIGGGFIQPQQTGPNPFRQSLFSTSTGQPQVGGAGGGGVGGHPFGAGSPFAGQNQQPSGQFGGSLI
ncbi:hypothetical protein TREMEDRAFT_41409 [Tremella mesenterica DSM 1558]|uniref:uncharacterized protein n=1 Tax=Tremella mesenterica (strain ATCC 24925 / CBS 8224 / DSM 1558 / NBRC 9311 / NRRL Y-6157 / RJB 2259-6 / UBC 559-6) TaxID=578456 RepID=UPI0003F4A401|nr:uncharacterized protein TREMEDRAFT_41409 [Tremella mesenterica DSM 1558]EIW71887.1 hypothetical protein TREMEDRAFT_41409 [Tremella mesenterica DSM 1558]